MFYSIHGKLIVLEPDDALYLAAVECGSGVAYQLKTTLTTAQKCPSVGEDVTLFTHFSVREGAVDLFGFFTLEERRCFRMLVSVSGVGPRFALSVLSSLSPSELAMCVASGDSKRLTQCKGVGAKTAQRIVLELKDKLGADHTETSEQGEEQVRPGVGLEGNSAEAISALVVLGYSRSEAAKAIAGCAPNDTPEQMIKAALKNLAKS